MENIKDVIQKDVERTRGSYATVTRVRTLRDVKIKVVVEIFLLRLRNELESRIRDNLMD